MSTSTQLPANERVQHIRTGGAVCATCFDILRTEGPNRYAHVNKLKRHPAVPATQEEAMAYVFRHVTEAMAACAVIDPQASDEGLVKLLVDTYLSTSKKVDEARRLIAAMERAGAAGGESNE